jgi:hypothetical protein
MMEGVLRSATPGSQPLSLSHTHAQANEIKLLASVTQVLARFGPHLVNVKCNL